MDQAAKKDMFETVLQAFRRRDLARADAVVAVLSAAQKKQIWLAVSATLAAENDHLGQLKARELAFAGESLSREEGLRFADMHIAVGQYDQAQSYVDNLRGEYANDPDIDMISADLLRWCGDIEGARDVLDAAYAAHPHDPGIMQALLDIIKDDNPALITGAKIFVESTSADMTGRRRLAFTLARRADKRGDYGEAWHFSGLANALYPQNAASDVPQYEIHLKRALALYVAVPAEKPSADTGLIYVIGPPRSGGSLLQSILAAHPDVASVGERGAMMGWLLPILDQCPELEQAVYNWNLVAKDLPASDIAGMRSASGGGAVAKIFADKMPHHSHVAGLLHRLHPAAQFIDVRRDPFDVALSIFTRDFSGRYGHTRSFSTIADYLCFQRKAVSAWEEAGVPIIRHNHGAFVSAPKDSGRALFEWLGLRWDDIFLKPEHRQAVVPTFSSVQVRDKVSNAYSGHGQHYREFLDSGVIDKLESLTA